MPYFVAAVVAGLMATAVLASPQSIVEVLQNHAGDVLFSVDTDAPVVALTIDDGPSEATPAILGALREHGARATFFMIGTHVESDPEGARSVVEEGHEIGNHMLVDEPSIQLPAEEFERQLVATAERLDPLGGTRWVRPASGWVNDRMVRQAAAHGNRVVLGSVYPFDAQLPAPALLAWYVLRNVRPGSIIVLHDGRDRGLRTVQVLNAVLPQLRARGFRVVTVSELLDVPSAAGP